MPCKIMLLGVFGAKIIRIYIHSKFFANLWVSNCDPKNNTKLTIPYATSLKNSTFTMRNQQKSNQYDKIYLKMAETLIILFHISKFLFKNQLQNFEVNS